MLWNSKPKLPPQPSLVPTRLPEEDVLDQVQRVLPRLGYKIMQADAEMQVAVAPPRHTYRVKLYAWPQQKRICLVASIDYCEERDLFLRDVPMACLDENYSLLDEAFVLIPREDGDRLIGCRRVVKPYELSDDELLEACQKLISRMQRMVARLHANGLIPNGPEPLED